MMQLRPYQQDVVDEVELAWAGGSETVCATMSTGAGKTVVFSHLIHKESGPTYVMAHRKELVYQISEKLAMFGLKHAVQAPVSVVKYITKRHESLFGKSFYEPSARVIVASVDTLVSRGCKEASKVKLVVVDEAHHVLAENKWGRAVSMFPNSRKLFVTALPERADRKGIGSPDLLGEGFVDALVYGPNMKFLMDNGYLTTYKYFLPETLIDLANVSISAKTGDYSKTKLDEAMKASPIIGDVVREYLKTTPGKRGITFTTGVDIAEDIAAKFNASGVPAKAVSSRNSAAERDKAIDLFREGKLLQLVNVDLFGEGFDVPACEVVCMARPTKSNQIYTQQLGRALRPEKTNPGKVAYIIDFVGNLYRHFAKMPDIPREFNLATVASERAGNKKKDEIPFHRCVFCTQPFPRNLWICPHCGEERGVPRRDDPVAVEGNLKELDPTTLDAMRKAVARNHRDPAAVKRGMQQAGMPMGAVLRQEKLQRERNEAVRSLSATIDLWAGWKGSLGIDEEQCYRDFFFEFKKDVLTAQAGNVKEMKAIEADIITSMLGIPS